MNNNSKKVFAVIGASIIGLSSCSNKSKNNIKDLQSDTSISSEKVYIVENDDLNNNDVIYNSSSTETEVPDTITTADVINTTTSSSSDNTMVDTTTETPNIANTTQEIIIVNDELNEEELIVALEDYEIIIVNEALNGNRESLKEKLDDYFTTTIGFIFCDEPIKGKRLSELSDSAKVKILSIADNINDTIEMYYPDYKITIKDKFNNTKEWTKDKLKKAGSILKNDLIEIIGQDKFDKIKTNYEKTKNLIKDLGKQAIDGIKNIAGKGLEKIKDWYHNKTS